MIALLTPMQSLELWRRSITELVRRESPDLSTRQMAVLLTVYLAPPPHTVRGLSKNLNVSKPAITRAIDRLERMGFTRRRLDEHDRRSVLLQRTVAGSVFLSEFGDLVTQAAQEVNA